MKDFTKFTLISCFLLIFFEQILAQFGGTGYYPYGVYGGIYGMFGRPAGYPMYGYYPQYPMYAAYPCFTSIYCGGYGGYPFYGNGFRTSYSSSSSSGFSASYGMNGGFFG
ncbi:uncharacterized protein ACRADG_001573 [Cochliomyia hominivorax]